MSPVQTEQEQADRHMNSKNWMLRHAAACFQTPMCSSKKRVLRHAAACCGMLRLHMLGAVSHAPPRVPSYGEGVLLYVRLEAVAGSRCWTRTPI